MICEKINIRNMKRIITLLLILASGFVFAQMGEKNFIDQNYIEVTGTAELEVMPDMIYLKIVLKDKENKDKLPLSQIEKKVFDKLIETGVDVNKDLSLLDFISNIRGNWFWQKDVLLTKQYQLIVRDVKVLQKVFFEFQKMEISGISIEKLENSKIEQHKKDVKVSAIKAAKEKAGLLATAVGQKTGKALFIQEVVITPGIQGKGRVAGVRIRGLVGSINKYKYSTAEVWDDSMAADIEFEKIKIESSILVKFALE
jgi:uncharacterized protein YggE